ncbi:MAG TPA: Ig-like domain-containing protein, partial [Gemmatimonadaceae bacterium]|nr:Ig-like domain-containing protein [Gemmatimonadaceae bacterium]
MQHGSIARRRLAVALLFALVAGVRAAAAENISLAWDPNPEPDVVGYRVYVGTQPGVYSSQVDVGNVTSYTLSTIQTGQRYCFTVAAYFAGPTLGSQSAEVCTDSNRPPTFQSPGNQVSAVGAALTLTLTASDPEGLPLTFSATGLPVGLTLNSNTGFISGTPTTVATSNVTVTASDSVLSTSQTFTWTISASLPGAVTPLRPSGTLATPTPTFEWESVATATSYRLWVDDASTTDPKIQLDLTPTQAGCATAGAVCRVSPGVTLQAGRGSWSVRASNASGAGPWSGALDFTVPDTTAPAITIATPTNATTYTTSSTTIALTGTASDNAAVTLVTWTNNTGGSGNAVGTTAWSVASIPLTVGSNVITVTARDAAGNIATDVLTVTKTDSEGPTLTLQAPTAAASYSTAVSALAMSGVASDNGGVAQVNWVSDRGGSGVATGTTAWSIASIALKPGINVIAVTAQDGAGNRTTKTLTTTLTDGEAPVVSIATPTASATYSTGNDTIAIGGSASDAFGVTQVSWSNDRGGSGTASGTTAWTAAGILLKPGANVITVTARDAAGNTGTDSLTITMTDGTAPVVAIGAPTSAATYTTTAATVTLGGTSSDAFGVTQVTWTSDKGGSGVAIGTTSWSVANAPLEIGTTVFTVTAKDAAGNAGTKVLAVTRTDGVPPTVSISTPVSASTYSTTNTTLALAGAASDNVSVSQVTWSNSKGGNGTAAGTTAWAVASISLQPGTNVITVTAKDAAGNVATDVLTVTLTDNVAPAISIASPTNADKYTTTAANVTVGGTASDFFGVTDVRWTNDRGGAGTASGTTSWSAGLALLPGVNVITVTASDAAGNSSTDRISITSDGKAPALAIATPAAATVTKDETVTVSGSASDDIGVAEVAWTNNRGGSGKASGTTAWSIANTALQSGVNVFTVVA